ncbi:MAG: zf-TFIIB domain-containing protein [Actinomycetota bacterium]|nr:zf-TFIIB domain-containing protein [Actinomycetota bacterium]
MQLLCPKCHNIMNQYERNRVLVDQCTECKGVFLDRGELEHLVEAEKAFYGSPAVAAGPSGSRAPEGRYDEHRYDDGRPDYDRGRYDERDRDGRPYRKKRRGSMLEDLFDF